MPAKNRAPLPKEVTTVVGLGLEGLTEFLRRIGYDGVCLAATRACALDKKGLPTQLQVTYAIGAKSPELLKALRKGVVCALRDTISSSQAQEKKPAKKPKKRS